MMKARQRRWNDWGSQRNVDSRPENLSLKVRLERVFGPFERSLNLIHVPSRFLVRTKFAARE